MARGIFLDGAARSTLYGTYTGLGLTEGITVAMGVTLLDNSATAKSLFCVHGNSSYGANARLALRQESANQLIFRIHNGSSLYIGRNFTFTNTGHAVIVCTYQKDGTTSASIKCFVNGVRADVSNSQAGTFTIPATSGPDGQVLGSWYNNALNRCQMLLTDFCLFRYGMTDAEAAELSSTLMNRNAIAGAPLGDQFHKDPTLYPLLDAYLRAEHCTLNSSGRVTVLKDLGSLGNNFTPNLNFEPYLTRDDSNENLLFDSNNPSSSTWTKGNVTVSGTNTVLETATTSTHSITASTTEESPFVGTGKIKVRVTPSGRTWVDLRVTTTPGVTYRVYCDLTGTGSFGTVVLDFLTKSIVRNSDGSFSIDATFTVGAAATISLAVFLADADNSSSYLGDITKGVILHEAFLAKASNGFLSSGQSTLPTIANPSPKTFYPKGNSLVKIGFNRIPLVAVSSSVDSEDASYKHTNLFFGGSSIFWKRAAAGTSSTFDFSLPSGATDIVTYLYLRGVREMVSAAGSFSVVVRGREFDNNFAAGSNVVLAAGEQGPNCGTFLEDWFFRVPMSVGYRFFRVIITTPVASVHTISKMFLGQLFEFERSPVYPFEKTYPDELGTFRTDSGAKFISSKGRRTRNYQFLWKYITNQERSSFDDSVGYYLKDFPIFLFEEPTSEHNILDNNMAIMGMANYVVESPVWKDRHNLTLSFSEDGLG